MKILIRKYEGEIDEIIIENADVIHIERMDNGLFWVGLGKDADDRILFASASGRAKIECLCPDPIDGAIVEEQ